MTDSPIIIALDVPSAEEARQLVRAIGPAASFYKVGLELFTAAGPDFVRNGQAHGGSGRRSGAGFPDNSRDLPGDACGC
jgi:orotidine-5'-phosphate decarboxylase